MTKQPQDDDRTTTEERVMRARTVTGTRWSAGQFEGTGSRGNEVSPMTGRTTFRAGRTVHGREGERKHF